MLLKLEIDSRDIKQIERYENEYTLTFSECFSLSSCRFKYKISDLEEPYDVCLVKSNGNEIVCQDLIIEKHKYILIIELQLWLTLKK